MNDTTQFFSASAGGGYQIERSLRFNSSDSAYLSRTPSSAGNRKTWTWAGWVKRSRSASADTLHLLVTAATGTGSNTPHISFTNSDTFGFDKGGGVAVRTLAVLRDFSAWYHLVVALDTTQAVAADRCKLYINGIQQATNGVTLGLNEEYEFNNTRLHTIGTNANGIGTFNLPALLADVYLIDGQALDPTDFGEFDATTGVWNPKAYTGTYGTNGFHLDFSDNSTAAALGTDTSGNGNDWTANNLKAGPTTVSNSWSAYLDGSGDYITVADNTALDMESSDFTIEGWIYNTGNLTASKALFSKRANSATVGGVLLYMASTGLAPSLLVDTGGSWGINFASSQSFVANRWNHFAAVRSGNTFTIYINGVSGGSATSSATIPNNSSAFAIGAMGADGSGVIDASYISNFRVVKGTAVYTGTFTPPTSPLTAITNTSLLTLQSSTFIDNGPSGFTVTAAGNTRVSAESPFEEFSDTDSLVDSPTNYGTDTGAGGEVRGNYATLNPLFKGSNATLSDGNLQNTIGGSSGPHAIATVGMMYGGNDFYCEFTQTVAGTNLNMVGLVQSGVSLTTNYVGADANSWGYFGNGSIYTNASSSAYGSSWGVNDVIGIAYKGSTGELFFYKNGVAQNSGNAAFSGLTAGPYFFAVGNGLGGTGVFNFGQRPFAYSAPSGFKALCTTNLPAPTIENGSDYFDALTYTGITQSPRTITGLDFTPSFVWVKNRSISSGHYLWDAVRGTDKNLRSDGTFDEAAVSAAANGIISTSTTGGFIVKNGITTGTNVGSAGSDAYVAWAWDAGSSTVTNNDGTISSQVRANPSAGFSIVTADNVGSGTIGHGLGVNPSLIIIKTRDIAGIWNVQGHIFTNPATNYMRLNATNGVSSDSSAWLNTAATSSVFSINATYLYGGTPDLVAYCFAPVEGYSAFGSYVGNGSTDGPMVFCNFRPRWVMIKRSDSTASWQIYDTARGSYNVVTQTLAANESTAESGFTSGYNVDLLSNGFKPRAATSNAINTSGATYIYAAFAEHPFQTSRAR